jgi:thioesterase domain-containing protein
LFFVHDGLGETLLYRTLALRLDEGATVFGLQPAQRADGSYINTSISTMAASHLRQVRAAQPEGPYHLAGLCAGGVIAVEMASQLQAQGQAVAFVGIMDSADVKAAEKPWLGLTARVSNWRDSLGHMPLTSLPSVFGRRALNYVRYKVAARQQRATDAARVAAMTGGEETTGVVDTPMAYLPLYEVAHRQHEPQHVLKQTAVSLYRATKGAVWPTKPTARSMPASTSGGSVAWTVRFARSMCLGVIRACFKSRMFRHWFTKCKAICNASGAADNNCAQRGSIMGGHSHTACP